MHESDVGSHWRQRRAGWLTKTAIRRLLRYGGTILILCAPIGCGTPIITPLLQKPGIGVSTTSEQSFYLAGLVESGTEPVSGASIQLYEAGSSGIGSSAIPLLPQASQTGAAGTFAITASLSCTSSAELYVVATGSSGASTQLFGSGAVWMAALGPCPNVPPSDHIVINEVTTVAAVSALAPFMQSTDSVGTDAAGEQALSNAFQTASMFANIQTGTAPGPAIPSGEVPPTQKLNTLADILASCNQISTQSLSGNSACGDLFAASTVKPEPQPSDTVDAALRIAQNPNRNVVPIFQLYGQGGPYTPALAGPPPDWTLALQSSVPVPTLSPVPGTQNRPISVTLSDADPSAAIYYTTDGSQATTQSTPYLGAFTLASSATVRAIAVVAGLSSLNTGGTYTISTPAVSVNPVTVTLSSSQTQGFAATVSGTSNSAVVWSVSPALGTISSSGVYVAPTFIAAPQTVTIMAISQASPGASAGAVVALVPPVTIALTPANTALGPGQTQSFTAAVANSANTAVTWSVSPAVGQISAFGTYTPPPTISSPQNVVVTAASVQDPTRKASSEIQLLPAGVRPPSYFVDNVNGNDSNSGTSEDAPFASIAKVNSLLLSPGQTVALKAGDEWHESLIVSRSGSAASPISYIPYGTGAMPVLTAADDVTTGWKQLRTTNVWQLPISSNPGIIEISNQPGTPVTTLSALIALGQFYWDGALLSVYSTDPPAASIEIPRRAYTVSSMGANNIIISGLEIRGAVKFDAYCGAPAVCNNWTWTGNTFSSSFSNELYFVAPEGAPSSSLIIINNSFKGGGSSGIKVSNGYISTISNNSFNYLCELYDSQSGDLENTFCDAIYGFSENGLDQAGTKVTYNTVNNIGLGQSKIPYGGGIHADTVTGWDIEHNTVSNTEAVGINIEKGRGSVVRYNLLIGAGFSQYQAGIMVRAGDGTTSYLASGNSDNQLVEYNTVALGSYWGCNIQISQNAGTVSLTNLTFRKNICSPGTSTQALYADQGANDAGDTYLSNSFGPQTRYFIVFNDAFIATYPALDAVLGYASGSLQGIPQFTDSNNADYSLLSTSPVLGIGAFP